MLQHLKQGRTLDWWQFGCVLYEALIGHLPFSARDRATTRRKTLHESPAPYDALVSKEAASIVTSLLKKNFWLRLGAADGDGEAIMAHPFYRDVVWANVSAGKSRAVTIPKAAMTWRGKTVRFFTPPSRTYSPCFVIHAPVVSVVR